MSMMDKAQTLSVLDLPDSLLLNVFTSLPLQSVRCVSLTCSHFSRIALDPQLWKTMFQRDYKVPQSVPLRPKASSWRAEYRRLYDESPAVLCEELLGHRDEVWHVSFSHNGEMFATCSKDGTVQVWNARGDHARTPCTLRFAADMKARFSLDYTEYSQFNKSDTLLLVSGVDKTFHGGRIVVFDLKKEFKVMNRLLMDPFDVFGAWYDDIHLLTQTIRWKNYLECISSVWLAKANREVMSERKYAMINPFRFCFNRPTKRIIVADVPVVFEESQSTSDEASPRHCGRDALSTDSTETFVHSNDCNGASGLVLPFPLSTEDSRISTPELQRASASPVSVRTKKVLIFTMKEADSEYVVGIKRMTEEEIREEEEATEGLRWPETENDLLPHTNRDIGVGRITNVDFTFNIHGKIVGMALSPDQRYLYVNCRIWLMDNEKEEEMETPPPSQEMDIHVIDLVTFTKIDTVLRSHKLFSPDVLSVYLNVNDVFVVSGSEDNQGYMWDRHYGVHVRCFPHDEPVAGCAFNPVNSEMLVTVSDDKKIKIWRSRRQMREVTEKKKVYKYETATPATVAVGSCLEGRDNSDTLSGRRETTREDCNCSFLFCCFRK